MTIQTQLLHFRTADNERLHGLLFKPPDEKSQLVSILVHDVAMNFYLPPLVIFGQSLAERGYHCFVINTRGRDWVCRAGNLTNSAPPPTRLLRKARWIWTAPSIRWRSAAINDSFSSATA